MCCSREIVAFKVMTSSTSKFNRTFTRSKKKGKPGDLCRCHWQKERAFHQYLFASTRAAARACRGECKGKRRGESLGFGFGFGLFWHFFLFFLTLRGLGGLGMVMDLEGLRR